MNKRFKRTTLLMFFITLFFALQTQTLSAQGLEDVIVETYYITDQFDALGLGSNYIPAGFITYRVYIDMKPGYVLQSIFGSPGHPLNISTTTSFFNHPIHGSYIPNLVMDPLISGGPLMLDTWIGVGAATQQKYGVLKEDDDTLRTVVNETKPLMLQGEHMIAGIPIKIRDGLYKPQQGLPPRVTQVGLDTLLTVFDKIQLPPTGFSFITENGGWGCLGGAAGPFPETNRVLIGQFTTDGEFRFEFNIQLGSPDQKVEQYVARNPEENELTHPGLIIHRPTLTYKSEGKHPRLD